MVSAKIGRGVTPHPILRHVPAWGAHLFMVFDVVPELQYAQLLNLLLIAFHKTGRMYVRVLLRIYLLNLFISNSFSFRVLLSLFMKDIDNKRGQFS